ncbi:hypothetical protein [Natrinema gari]|uniref:Uncharacterized protein n=1 Tax=Natrinema gari JCM 14663 TaxID=1230459 RepID=L9YY69_9EURY|nr:hypothetical protein [Natrinema gari]ELY79205.1 hypothetical protein C486_12451 [Natrinema gari JCM 14663]
MGPGLDERSSGGSHSRWHVTRREALVALGGAALAASTGPSKTTMAADRSRDGLVRVRVYPGRVPFPARVRYGLDDLRRDWPTPLRDALAAIEEAFDQVLAYARDRSRLESVDIRVERGAPIRFPPASIPLSIDAVLPSLRCLLERFRDRIRSRNALTGRCCHVLLEWSPLNYRIGYGGTLAPHSITGEADGGDTGDAQAVVNVGATEVWDSRPVTRAMAIHEAMHTFLPDDIVDAIGDAVCDHELGTAVRTDAETLEVSPMATAYAGPDRIGGGTRFHGTGCCDRSRFYRHDGTDGIDTWTYTTELSEATCEAVTRYLERQFAIS